MAFDRSAAVAWYRRNRARSRAIFDLLARRRTTASRSRCAIPIVFYEGHLPGFSFNTLVKKALGRPSIDARLETLFARGIDPHEATQRRRRAAATRDGWPSRDEVQRVRRRGGSAGDRRARARRPRSAGPSAARSRARRCSRSSSTKRCTRRRCSTCGIVCRSSRSGGRPATRRASTGAPPRQRVGRRCRPAARRSAWTAARSRSAGTTSIRRCASTCRRSRSSGTTSPTRATSSSSTPAATAIRSGGGRRTGSGCSASGSRIRCSGSATDDALALARDVRAGAAAAVVAGVRQPCRGGGVTRAGAARGCRPKRNSSARHSASPDGERAHPWGDAEPDADRTASSISRAGIPSRPAAHPAGASAWGVEDLVGNGWEWTSTPFAPFPGFRAMASYPEYSADFFDGEHVVMKGASPATARELLRPTFRNWFRPRYPYVYATFRCVRHDASTCAPRDAVRATTSSTT